MRYNYALSDSRLILELWTLCNFMRAVLLADPMIEMTTTNPRCKLLHILLTL